MVGLQTNRPLRSAVGQRSVQGRMKAKVYEYLAADGVNVSVRCQVPQSQVKSTQAGLGLLKKTSPVNSGQVNTAQIRSRQDPLKTSAFDPRCPTHCTARQRQRMSATSASASDAADVTDKRRHNMRHREDGMQPTSNLNELSEHSQYYGATWYAKPRSGSQNA